MQAEARLEGLNQEELQLQSGLQGLAKQKVLPSARAQGIRACRLHLSCICNCTWPNTTNNVMLLLAAQLWWTCMSHGQTAPRQV